MEAPSIKLIIIIILTLKMEAPVAIMGKERCATQSPSTKSNQQIKISESTNPETKMQQGSLTQ